MKIKVEKPNPQQVDDMKRCPTWTKEASVFEWEYDAQEVCYLLEGEVRVTASDGEVAEFAAGDLVTFPRGLKCTWDVRRPVRKHYRFE